MAQSLLLSAVGCGSTTSTPGGDAGLEMDAAWIEDAPADRGDDPAETGPAGYFVTGDLAGATRFAAHNLSPVAPGFTLIEARVGPSADSSFWSLNFESPAGPFPVTLTCGSGFSYLQFIDRDLSPATTFSSRSPMGSCSFTFVEPSLAGTYEGTFTAVLLRSGTSMYYPVTQGRFRYPRAADGGG